MARVRALGAGVVERREAGAVDLGDERRELDPLGLLVGPLDVEPVDDPREGRALHDEGDDRDRERDQDELRAVRQV